MSSSPRKNKLNPSADDDGREQPKYPCPICHCAFCDHWIGWSEDGKTIVPRAGVSTNAQTVGDFDILFQQRPHGAALVYRRPRK
jgi:hypothetical protein